MIHSILRVGDRVRRRRAWDGSAEAGNPLGPSLTILRVYRAETFSICQLADGGSEFEFNLFADCSEIQCESQRQTVRLAS